MDRVDEVTLDSQVFSLEDEIEEYIFWCMAQQLKEIDSNG